MKLVESVLSVILLSGSIAVAATPETVPEIRPGILQGYLALEDYPDSVALLPAPPADGSTAWQLDRELNARLLTLQDTPRFELAAEDNRLAFPAAAGTFSCALGAPITESDTPYLYQLIRRTLADAGLATYGAKRHYQRKRPFLVNDAPNCASAAEQTLLENDPSYPSGHSAVGWAWALILASLAPDRADAVLERGLTFAESRAVCNVHWPSDVAAGRTIGAAAVALLHGNETFRHDLAIARQELAAVRAAGLEPTRDCAAEVAAMAVQTGAAIKPDTGR